MGIFSFLKRSKENADDGIISSNMEFNEDSTSTQITPSPIDTFEPTARIQEHSKEEIEELMATEKPRLNMLYKKEAKRFFVFKLQVAQQDLAILNVQARSNEYGEIVDRASIANGVFYPPGYQVPVFFNRKMYISSKKKNQKIDIDILYKDREGRQWTQCYKYTTNNSSTGKAISQSRPA